MSSSRNRITASGTQHGVLATSVIKILTALTGVSSQTILYGSALLTIAAMRGTELPGILGVLATGLGVEALGNILNRVAGNEAVPTDEIREALACAISESKIAELVTGEEFQHAIRDLMGAERLIQAAVEHGEYALAGQLADQYVTHQALLSEVHDELFALRGQLGDLPTYDQSETIRENVETLGHKLDQVLAAVYESHSATGWVPGPPVAQQSLRLQPIDFSSLISRATKGFVGREEVFAALSNFIHHKPKGYFHIIAESGLGKTSIAARLTQIYEAPCYFFNQRAGRVHWDRALDELWAQLIIRYNLPNRFVGWQSHSDSDYLCTPLLHAKDEGKQVVIVIDALDEAVLPTGYQSDQPPLPQSLPDGVYIVLAHRPQCSGPDVDPQTPVEEYHIKWDADEQNAAIRRYLWQQSRLPEIQDRLRKTSPRMTPDSFVSQYTNASEGNFMYLSYVLEDDRLDLARPPHGLRGYYEHLWSNPVPGRERDSFSKEVIALLAAAQEPVPLSWLAALTGQPEDRIRTDALDRWGRVLGYGIEDERPRRWRIVHHTFAEFLSDHARIEVARVHAAIAHYYLHRLLELERQLGEVERPEQYDWSVGYAVRHLVTHLKMAGMADEMHRLLNLETKAFARAVPQARTLSQRPDVRAIAGKPAPAVNYWYHMHLARNDLRGYTEDLDAAWYHAEGTSQDAARRTEADLPLDSEVRYALMHSSLHSLAANVPPELVIRLVKSGAWTPLEGLNYSRQTTSDRGQTVALLGLVPSLAAIDPVGALSIARGLTSELERTQAFISLIPSLPDYLVPEVKAAAQRTVLGDRYARLMGELSIRLVELGQPTEALAIARTIRSENAASHPLNAAENRWHIDILARLVDRLAEGRQFQEACEAALMIENEEFRSRNLTKLALKCREKDDLPQAFDVIRHISWGKYRVPAMTALASSLTEAEWAKYSLTLVELAQEQDHADDRFEGLLQLVPYLVGSVRDHALELARQTVSDLLGKIKPVYALCDLAWHLQEPEKSITFEEAVQKARTLRHDGLRVTVLAELLFRIPGDRRAGITGEIIQDSSFAFSDGSYYFERSWVSATLPPAEAFLSDLMHRLISAGYEGEAQQVAHKLGIPLPVRQSRWQDPIPTNSSTSFASPLHDNPAETEELRRTDLAVLRRYLSLAPASRSWRGTDAARIQAFELALRAESLPVEHQAVEIDASCQAALRINDPADRSRLFLDLSYIVSERFKPEMVGHAYRAARSIQDASDRAKRCCTMVYALSREQRTKAILEILEDLAAISDTELRQTSLRSLAQPSTASLLQDSLREIFQTRRDLDSWERSVALTAHLPEEMSLPVIEIALNSLNSVRDQHERFDRLRLLSPYLPDRLSEKTLAFTRWIGDEDQQDRTLMGFVRCMSTAEIDDVLPRLLQTGNSQAADHARRCLALRLVQLAHVERAFELVRGISSGRERDKAEAGLIRALAASRSPAAALSESRRIRDPFTRVNTILEVATDTTKTEAHRWLDMSLRIVSSLEDLGQQARILASIASYLPEWDTDRVVSRLLSAVFAPFPSLHGEELTYAINDALIALAPRLSRAGCLRAIDIITRSLRLSEPVTRRLIQSQVLAPLLPRLAELGDQERALNLVSSFRKSDQWSPLARLAPFLAVGLRNQVLDELVSAYWPRKDETLEKTARELAGRAEQETALDLVARLEQERWRSEGILHLSPFLRGIALRRAESVARGIRDEWFRNQALAAVYASSFAAGNALEEYERIIGLSNDENRAYALAQVARHLRSLPLFERSLHEVGRMQHHAAQRVALEGLVPFLPDLLLDQAIDTIAGIRDEDNRASAWMTLAPRLTLAPQLFTKAVEIILKMQPGANRASVLAAFTAPWASLCHSHKPIAHRAWQKAIRACAGQTRQGFLRDLEALIPVLIALGGDEETNRVSQAIRTASLWWP